MYGVRRAFHPSWEYKTYTTILTYYKHAHAYIHVHIYIYTHIHTHIFGTCILYHNSCAMCHAPCTTDHVPRITCHAPYIIHYTHCRVYSYFITHASEYRLWTTMCPATGIKYQMSPTNILSIRFVQARLLTCFSLSSNACVRLNLGNINIRA